MGLAADGVTPILTNLIVDTGAALVPHELDEPTVPGILPTSTTARTPACSRLGRGLENIYLISRDRNNVVRP